MTTLTERILRHPFFSGMKPEHVAIACHGATESRFEAGQIIFSEGEPANRFYLIESGSVALEAHEPADGTFPIQTLEAGEVLGWSWLFPPFTWHFRARVLTPTNVIALDGAHLLVAAERNAGFGYALMKKVGQILIHRLQATRKQFVKGQLHGLLKDQGIMAMR
ncbi:MAG: cyclic nucleotide-binding domain-containing protein [Verrucomicrobiales bacterium]|nr:cyclic nucleotide-binding domain-containing protein [Verrucomicrobiales bacterium]